MPRHPALRPEAVEPTHTPIGVDPDEQRAALAALRALAIEADRVRDALHERVYELAARRSVSRPDMATALGLSVARIGQIIRERADLDREPPTTAAVDETVRQMLSGAIPMERFDTRDP